MTLNPRGTLGITKAELAATQPRAATVLSCVPKLRSPTTLVLPTEPRLDLGISAPGSADDQLAMEREGTALLEVFPFCFWGLQFCDSNGGTLGHC